MTPDEGTAGDATDREATEGASVAPAEPTAEPSNGADLRADVQTPEADARPALHRPPEPIVAADSLALAGRKAMWTHLERMLARESSLGDPDRPDELRRYRVAIRRLRAGIRLFATAYPDREVKPLRKRLSDLARAVGTVRDLDLRIADLNRWALERGDDSRAAVAPLLEAWGIERAHAATAVLDRVGTRRHRRLLEDLVLFVESRPLPDRKAGFAGAHTVGDRLASTMWAAYEEVRAYAAVVRWADVATLHGLRIATKRLRDGIELLADLVGPARTPLLERLVMLQDHLGTMNDAAVASDAVRAFLEEHHGHLRPAAQAEIAGYLADREREVTRLRRSSVRPWRNVAGITFARRLARLVVVPAASPTVPARRRVSTRGAPRGTRGKAVPAGG